MRTAKAFPGARAVDSLPFSQSGSRAQADILRASGVDCLIGYIGSINAARLESVLSAGLGFMPVTRANRFDGNAAVAELRTLQIPAGTTVWLDLEGKTIEGADWTIAPSIDRERITRRLITLIDTWAQIVAGAGYEPGLYVGSPQPLTATELWRLRVVRYWKAFSRVYDRFGRTHDEPDHAGWCMIQLSHGEELGQLWPPGNVPNKTLVDVNAVQVDRRDRLPSWVVS